ncbi:MAG TPA: universal stress protein [Nitrososphaeraceae archaeon]|nr:universal stress protein [Nitrososphaeraceae archaeon]
MISKILIPIDGSKHAEKAFEYACYLGERCKARLLILYVIEEFATIGYSISKEVEQEKEEMLQKYLIQARNTLSTDVDILKTKGNDAAEEILRIANNENADTIVVGSRGFSASKDFLLGSVSYKVMHYAKCPVVIVR